MKAILMIVSVAAATLIVALTAAGTAGAFWNYTGGSLTQLPPTLECERLTDGYYDYADSIRVSPSSTLCITREFLGPQDFGAPAGCTSWSMYPTFRWYHGNQLTKDGTLRANAKPYATLHEVSMPISVCS
jgi:hypothetical protein